MDTLGLAASAETPDELRNVLDCDSALGLSDAEAVTRLRLYGPNLLETTPSSPLMKFAEQFQDPMIGLLCASAVASVVVGEYDDAISIVLAVIIVLTVAFIQEWRSEKSLALLNNLVPHKAKAIRSGKTVQLGASDLVPGDLIIVGPGDRVPADVRLVESVGLEVDESSLTGESDAVPKSSECISRDFIRRKSIENSRDDLQLENLTNIAFMGTLVRAGHGRGVVVHTGIRTQFGKIFELMQDQDKRRTPLQDAMDNLGRTLSYLSIGFISLVVFVGWIQGRPALEMFTLGISLAVAAIPEGLPICTAVTLALGVGRMARKNAIVRRLPAVEVLGCVTTICVDKTGTITANNMVVDVVEKPFESEGQSNRSSQALLLTIAVRCGNAHMGEGEVVGSATESAIVKAAIKIGAPASKEPMHRRVHEMPFSSHEKWMGVQSVDEFGIMWTFAKGGIEQILQRCTHVHDESDPLGKRILFQEDRGHLITQAALLENRGLRVLALAQSSNKDNSKLGIYQDLTFMGIIGLTDPPRPGSASTIAQLKQCGVRTIMLTGDSKGTASAIAIEVGINGSNSVYGDHKAMSGADLDRLNASGADLSKLFTNGNGCRVFYRMTPQHKRMVVTALQQSSNVVAMTGDGINDAPALQLADIGIAMGIAGSDVTKEAADMILVDDELSTLLVAIREGKCIFFNIRNFLRFQLSTSFAALFIVALSMLLGQPAPLNAMQILWINILMDGPPAQSLGLEPVDEDIVRLPPRRRSEPVVSKGLLFSAVVSAAVIATGTLAVYTHGWSDGGFNTEDRTLTFTAFVFFDLFNAFSCRSQSKSVMNLSIGSNRALVAAVSFSLFGQLMVVYVPFFQSIFHTVPLSFYQICAMALIASSVLIVDEIRKLWSRA